MLGQFPVALLISICAFLLSLYSAVRNEMRSRAADKRAAVADTRAAEQAERARREEQRLIEQREREENENRPKLRFVQMEAIDIPPTWYLHNYGHITAEDISIGPQSNIDLAETWSCDINRLEPGDFIRVPNIGANREHLDMVHAEGRCYSVHISYTHTNHLENLSRTPCLKDRHYVHFLEVDPNLTPPDDLYAHPYSDYVGNDTSPSRVVHY